MDSIEQREGRGPHKEAAMESWANARIDPRHLFASCPPIEALGGGAISDIHQFRSTTPENSPTSNKSGIFGPNTENFELSGLEIDINTFDDSWTPYRLPGTYKLLSSFHVGSEKVNDDLKLVNSPPWDNIDKTASTKPVSLDSSFYSTQYENKLPGELPLSTRSLLSARPPSTCTSVSSMPLSPLVLNQHQSDLYSGSESQHNSSMKFQSQVTGPASSSDPTSCPKARPRASKPKLKTGCINCKTRRVKCDETRPGCFRCVRAGFKCDGFPASKILGRVTLADHRLSNHSSSSTASIISTPSLSWSASSVAESDELVNTDLKLPHDRQQGVNTLERMQLRHLRIGCLECHTSKINCRCPSLEKESDSNARPVESSYPGPVADFANSGTELNTYQIPNQYIGNFSQSPAHITQCALAPGRTPKDLAPSNPARSKFSMENPRTFEDTQALSPPRHTQNPLNEVFDMEPSYNDRSTPSYPWHYTPFVEDSLMPIAHNIESDMTQLEETTKRDLSKEWGVSTPKYHSDQKTQKLDGTVHEFDDGPRSSNETPPFQWSKNITNQPGWAPLAERLEAGRWDPIFPEPKSTELVNSPVFSTYFGRAPSSSALAESDSIEKYNEPVDLTASHNVISPRHYSANSDLEGFPFSSNVSKSSQSPDARVFSEYSGIPTEAEMFSGSSLLPSTSRESSSEYKSFSGFEPTGKNDNYKFSDLRRNRKPRSCRQFSQYKHIETTKAYPCPYPSRGKEIQSCERLFSRKDNLKRHIFVRHGSLSENVNDAARDNYTPSPSFTFRNNLALPYNSLIDHVYLETNILPPAESHVLQVLSSNIGHNSENLLEDSTSRDQLQISSAVLLKDNQMLTTCQIQHSDRPSSPNIDDKMAIEPMPSVEVGSSSSRSNTLSSFTEDETDWGEDEVTNSVQDLDFSSFSSISQEHCLSQAQVKDSLTQPVFSPMKLALINRIMKEFWIIFNQETESIQNRSPATLTLESAGNYKCNTDTSCNRGEDSSRDSGSRSSAQATNTREKSTQRTLGPRKRGDEDDQEQNDGEEQSPKRPRTLLTPPQNPDDTAKFACPYRKRDPRKYCVQFWRSCALTPQDSVARVKGHLYRHHRIYPCQRCKGLFENQDAVNQHLMQRDVCELKDTEPIDGITTEIFEKLRSKKKAQRDQTEADRWKDIFKLLFPGEMIPSPYFEAVQEEIVYSPDSRELEAYEEYCRRELPRTFRAALEVIVHNESQPMEESIRNQLMNIIRDCQDRVFSRYRSSSSSTAAIGSPSRSRMLRSPEVDHSQESIDSISMASNAQSEARIALPFFQPPPPQAHLRSRLEVSDLQLNSSKAPDGSAPSDSGYSSNESSNTLGTISSSRATCHGACMSNSQPDVASAKFSAACEVAPWTMDKEQFDVTAENDVSDSKKNSIFQSSFNNPSDNDFDNATENAFDGSFDTSQYVSQFMYEDTWDPSVDNLGMENPFSSDETL